VRHLPALLAAAALLAAPSARGATRTPVALLPALGANVPAGQLAAAGDVLRAHLEGTGHFLVIRAASPSGAAEPTAQEAGWTARENGASIAVVLNVSRLGETAVVRLAAYAPTGALVHEDRIGALGPDDLDPALERLARGLLGGRRAAEIATIDTVTAKEERPLPKMTAFMAGGLKLGSILPVHAPLADVRRGGAGGLGAVWYYDAREWLADVSIEGYTSNLDAWRPDPDRALVIAMGVYRPLSKGNVAPYLGLGAAYTVARFNFVTGHGIQPRALAGVLVGRLSNVAMRIEAGWFVNAFPVREAATGREIYSHGALASMTFVVSEPTVGRR
jgi:hypothetical protein